MGYTIEPMPLISFLDENKMKLPRFQRKATWNKKQNFELCISVFQEYPVGVVIVNKEQKFSSLLDGRQRRTALKQMRENPVELYDWSMSFLGFKKREDPIEITNIFWDKIAKYLQSENNDKGTNDSEDEEIIYDGEEIEVENETEDSFNQDTQKKGLQTLLDIILMVHQKKVTGSAWELLFDYTKFFKKIMYAPLKNGERKVDPVLLRRFILQIQRDCEVNNSGQITMNYFIEYYLQQYDISDLDSKNFKKYVEHNWKSIENSIQIIEKSEKVFADARIGVIWLTKATPLDAQNIFSRINSGGTQLKAEELLSAKPYWNISIDTEILDVIEKVEKMYSKLDIPKPDSIVRWDMAAIMLSRIDSEHLIFDRYEIAKKKNEISLDEITLGFKLLSSIYNGGMSAKHVSDLENSNPEKGYVINWERDINNLVEELNIVIKILMDTDFFQTFQVWKKPIAKLLGNAIALEFITIIYLDWKDRGCPTISSGELKALQRDAKILFDRLVYEYATKVWRGSGDSKMANDIKNWKNRILAIDNLEWKDLIDGACEGTYNGSITNVKTLKPVLYYYYVLTDCLPVNQNNVIYDVDHIIPQEMFKSNNMVNHLLENSLSNLALLPKKDNINKKSNPLNKITDTWLKSMINIYTGINKEDFEKYSDIININLLKDERKKRYLQAFETNRGTKLSN